MKFATMQNLAYRLSDFESTHGHVVTNALTVYAERMRKDADAIQAQYDAIKDSPEARTAQDASMVTTMGLFHAAQAVREAADTADAAREAYENLSDSLEDLES